MDNPRRDKRPRSRNGDGREDAARVLAIRILAILAMATAMALPATAAAGTIIETTSTANGPSTIYIAGDNVRMESASGSAGATIFHADASELIFVDHGAQQYQRIGKQDVQRIAERIDRVRSRMQQQLQNLPEDQRKQMRQRMQQLMPRKKPASEIRIERGSTTTIAGVQCQQATVHLEGETAHDVCVASPENLGLSPTGYQAIMQMFRFFDQMTGGMSETQGEIGPRTTVLLMNQLGGIPIRSQGGGTNWRMTAVRNTDIPSGRFQVPAGYTEVEPGSGSGGQ